MEEKSSKGNWNDTLSPPEEDVASTKNKSSSADSERRVGSHDTMAPPKALKMPRPKKPSITLPFISPANGSERLSVTNAGEITSPRPMSMEPQRSEASSVVSQASFIEKGQLVISGLTCFFKENYRPRMANFCFIQDTLQQAMGRVAHQSAEAIRSAGPYLNSDGTFKSYIQLMGLSEGTVIYGRMESIYTIRVGTNFQRPNVCLSVCGGFVFKKRKFSKTTLDSWKLLSYCDYVMSLSGVMKAADFGCIYQVTERMQSDLRQARKKVTLKQLAARQDERQWSCTCRNFSNIVCSVLKGIIHLNEHGLQHYDVKEDNVFVNMPHGCKCPSILECICDELAEIKIGDFDTLGGIANPRHMKYGTNLYRPPESEASSKDLTYEHPTRDSWSVLVIILHFCGGAAMNESNAQMKEMPWLKNQELLYAKDRLLELFESCGPRLQPVARFAAKCLKTDYKIRPTPQEILDLWDTSICDV